MFCPNCGTQNNDDARFCANCGTALNNTSAQQPIQQPMYQQPAYQPAPVIPGKGLGIAAMVVGIVSLVLFCYWIIALPCAIVGIVLGSISLSKAKATGAKNSFATTGVVCSCVALGLAIFFLIFVIIGVAQSNFYLNNL